MWPLPCQEAAASPCSPRLQTRAGTHGAAGALVSSPETALASLPGIEPGSRSLGIARCQTWRRSCFRRHRQGHQHGTQGTALTSNPAAVNTKAPTRRLRDALASRCVPVRGGDAAAKLSALPAKRTLTHRRYQTSTWAAAGEARCSLAHDVPQPLPLAQWTQHATAAEAPLAAAWQPCPRHSPRSRAPQPAAVRVRLGAGQSQVMRRTVTRSLGWCGWTTTTTHGATRCAPWQGVTSCAGKLDCWTLPRCAADLHRTLASSRWPCCQRCTPHGARGGWVMLPSPR